MNFVRLAEFSPDTDVNPIAAALSEKGIGHKFLMEEGAIALYVDADAHIGEVVALVRAAVEAIEQQQQSAGLRSAPSIAMQFQRTPAMMLCLALSILGAMVPEWYFGLLPWLTFQDFQLVSPTEIQFSALQDTLARGEYWRLITPIFIHFGIFHIAFNGLWLWEFGRRIETLTGSVHFLMLVIVSGAVSNFSQYFWGGPSLFGGMSGVLYALLGYIWIRNKVAPSPGLALPRGIIGFMLAWLLICMTGIVDLLFRGSIANAAHASGLISGMFLGAVFGAINRQRSM
ncbi:MAG: rhomboid family intramembrane serine protease [Porticoccaceae bacterium]